MKNDAEWKTIEDYILSKELIAVEEEMYRMEDGIPGCG